MYCELVTGAYGSSRWRPAADHRRAFSLVL